MQDVVEHRYGHDDIRLVRASFRTHRFVSHGHSEYAVAAIAGMGIACLDTSEVVAAIRTGAASRA